MFSFDDKMQAFLILLIHSTKDVSKNFDAHGILFSLKAYHKTFV